MSYETVIWEQSGPLGRLTLNRPETLNAWTVEFGSELRQVIEGPASDETVRAVLLTGAGRGFSSGADLKAGFIEEPNEESGAYVFFDWKGEHYRACFDDFEKRTKQLDRFKQAAF